MSAYHRWASLRTNEQIGIKTIGTVKQTGMVGASSKTVGGNPIDVYPKLQLT